MRGERGQASIEWVGAAMLIALTLGTAGRIAARVDAASVGPGLLKATICAAKGDCHGTAATAEARAEGGGEARVGDRADREPPPANRGPVGLVTLPPLVPAAPLLAEPEAPRAGRGWRRAARRAAGRFWRRAWLLCFGYERARYGLLHPETGPRQTVPVSGVIQMTNDCASPVDFAHDREHLRPR